MNDRHIKHLQQFTFGSETQPTQQLLQ